MRRLGKGVTTSLVSFASTTIGVGENGHRENARFHRRDPEKSEGGQGRLSVIGVSADQRGFRTYLRHVHGWVQIRAAGSQTPVESCKRVGKHDRHDQDARPEDERVRGLTQIKGAHTTYKQVADGKVEEAP
jgi:hypothetical protein